MIRARIEKRLGEFELHADFEVPSRGITALFGHSGAGKTSIVHAMAGILRPDAGEIRVDDLAFFDSAARTDLPIERRRVGYVFQDSRLFPHLTVERNLRYGWRRAPVPRALAMADVVEVLGIGHLLNRWPYGLSGGERQRVALGRALLSQPRLLLMDEPLASLDALRKAEILPYIERLRDEFALPIVYVSHSIDEVTRLSDHIVLVADGRTVASGPLVEIMSSPDFAPYVGRFEAGAVLECEVAAHDARLLLTTLTFADGRLRVPLVDLPVGRHVRARLRARDVSLALTEPTDISITNHLKGAVVSLVVRDGPFVDVVVDLGQTRLRSLITRESCERLRLDVGNTVWALIKTVALDSRSVGFRQKAREDVALQ